MNNSSKALIYTDLLRLKDLIRSWLSTRAAVRGSVPSNPCCFSDSARPQLTTSPQRNWSYQTECSSGSERRRKVPLVVDNWHVWTSNHVIVLRQKMSGIEPARRRCLHRRRTSWNSRPVHYTCQEFLCPLSGHNRMPYTEEVSDAGRYCLHGFF